MQFKNLFIELTRKCTTGCEYCLRGDCQNISISKDILESIFDEVSHVDELMITGGEPLAYSELIKILNETINDKKTTIGHFRIVTSLNDMVGDDSFKELDKLHSITIEPLLDYVEISYDADKKLMTSKKRAFLSKLKTDHEYVMAGNDIHNHKRNGFLGCYIASGKANGLKEAFNSSYLNGFIVNGDTVCSDVYISSNGNVVTSCDLSYDNIDKSFINFGSVLKSRLSDIIKSHAKTVESVKMIEIPTSGVISFSQYWESISEDKRGDYFGYVLHLMYDRNLTGYGVFEVLKNHPEFNNLKELENFSILLNLEDSAEPPWFGDEDRSHVQNVKLELVGYLRIISSDLFTKNPLFELIDLYYHDLPYCAGRRLRRYLERVGSFITVKKSK